MASLIARFRNGLRPLIPGVFVFAKGLGLLYSPRSFLRTSGYLRSVSSYQPCRKDGSPIPWMNYAVVGFLDDRLRTTHAVFEFGSGNSTHFFAHRVGNVVSVESDPSWYARVSANLPSNARVVLCDPYSPERYVSALREQRQFFDLIVVDGRHREACLAEVWRWLTPAGVVLLDDSSRSAYAKAMDELGSRGFRRLLFEGLKPAGIRSYQSTLFYRDNNAFGI